MGNNKVVIHGKETHLSHPNGYIPVIKEVPRGSDFYTVGIMNATKKDPTPYKPMPSIYKMLPTVMLRSSLEPGCGLRKNLDGIIKPIMILEKLSKCGLGYVPNEAYERKMKKKGPELVKRLPMLYQSFPIPVKPTSDGLEDEIGNLFEEYDVVVEDFLNKTENKTDEPEEKLSN